MWAGASAEATAAKGSRSTRTRPRGDGRRAGPPPPGVEVWFVSPGRAPVSARFAAYSSPEGEPRPVRQGVRWRGHAGGLPPLTDQYSYGHRQFSGAAEHRTRRAEAWADHSAPGVRAPERLGDRRLVVGAAADLAVVAHAQLQCVLLDRRGDLGGDR